MRVPPQDDEVSAALRHVITRYDGLIRGIGRRYGLATADLDGLLQDVRIRIWKSLAESEKIAAAPASYVYRTAMSAAVDRIRRARARREEPLDAGPGAGETVADAVPVAAGRVPDPQSSLEGVELMDALARAIDELSDSRRPVVRMYLAGYPREEIADLLGWSEAKTRNLLYRGLADLREALLRLGVRPGVTT